jgi:hypothetical protein
MKLKSVLFRMTVSSRRSASPSRVGAAFNKLDAWMKEVEARADRYPPGFVLDDSYEAIYGERENSQL